MYYVKVTPIEANVALEYRLSSQVFTYTKDDMSDIKVISSENPSYLVTKGSKYAVVFKSPEHYAVLNNKLKPCPFCGHPAEIKIWGKYAVMEIRCSNCKASMEAFNTSTLLDGKTPRKHFTPPFVLISDWNFRHTDKFLLNGCSSCTSTTCVGCKFGGRH